MQNIEMFNFAVGEILGECYQSFPVPVTVSKGVIGHSVVEHFRLCHPDYLDHGDPEFQIAQHTISWLVRAGYIWIEEDSAADKRIVQATLSPKGLELLNAVPESVDDKEPIGAQLAKGVKGVGAGVFQNLVTQVLSSDALILQSSPQF